MVRQRVTSWLAAALFVEGTRAIQSEEFGLAGTEDRGRDLVALPDGRTIQVRRFGASPAVFVLTPNSALDDAAGERGVECRRVDDSRHCARMGAIVEVPGLTTDLRRCYR
jgi:hypothetical protein